MQDRYTGDIGDYFKYGLLRRLSHGRSLGVLWYLFPNEDHNADGGHVGYLNDPERWRDLDPELFDILKSMVHQKHRNIASIAHFGALGNARFSYERLDASLLLSTKKADWRKSWFRNAHAYLSDCDIVFADPDNGLCADDTFKPGQVKFWKRIPVSEAQTLAYNRTAIIYHHNTHRKGGHRREIEDWMAKLGAGTIALRWRAHNNRSFFILNPTKKIQTEAKKFASEWGSKAEFYPL